MHGEQVSAISPGTLIDFRFEVECLVGSGGMGTVFRAHDRYRGTKVALKLLSRPVESPLDRERFIREATILSELHHPGIVSYVAHGISAEGWPFLAMEWLVGENLADRLARGPLSVKECFVLLDRAAAALHTAHRRDIIHRDIKPSNLFLRDGQIESLSLIDFGIARRVCGTKVLTSTGVLVGTPEYMAPEQARGELQLWPSADIFSLGCVLYECLTGTPPFQGTRAIELLAKLLHGEPAPPRALRREVPVDLEDLVLRMLSKDPAQRPKDAAALVGEGLRSPAVTRAGGQVLEDTSAAPVLSDMSQQVLCVVAAQARGAADLAPTIVAQDETLRVKTRSYLLQDILPSGDAESVWLADGTLVVTLKGGKEVEVVDQAARAAFFALTLKRHWPSAQVVVTTGTGMLAPMLPAGEVIGRTLQLLERPGEEIWLDRMSAELIEDRFVVQEVGEGLILQGRLLEVNRGPDPCRERLPLFGRQLELELLTTWLRGRVEEGVAGAALVIAPAGAGKSRLLDELLLGVASLQLSVVRGLEVTDALDPEERWAVLRGMCERQPVLLVLDDLQTVSALTVKHLEAALRELSELPLLILGLGRPQTRQLFPQLFSERAQEFSLRPLGPQSSEALIRKVLGSRTTPHQVVQLARRAAGNAQRLRLLLRAAQREEEPPASFLIELQAQILRFAPQSGRVLRAASLLGDVFTNSSLSRVLGMPAQTYIKDSLCELVAAGMLCSLPAPTPPREYSFADPLIREAAFRLLTPRDARLT